MTNDKSGLNDADILDIARKLRTYLTALDNSHLLMDKMSSAEYDDIHVLATTRSIVVDIASTTQKLSNLLRLIESSKPYKSMLKKFNVEIDHG